DVLDSDDALARRHRNDAIDQQEWVAVGQNPLDVVDIQGSYDRLRCLYRGRGRITHALDSYGPKIILYRAPTAGSRGQEEPRARRLTVVPDRKGRSETDSMTKKPTRPSPKSNHQIAQMRLGYFEEQRDHMVDIIRRLVEIES